MGFFDGLFTSAADAEKNKRTLQRKAKRAVERRIEDLGEKAAQLEKERNKLWNTARDQMISGQKSAAAATLKFYKSNMVRGQHIEKMRLYSQNQLDSLTNASDMQALSGALSDLAVAMNIDPDKFQDVMDQMDDKGADVREITKLMDSAFNREMARLDNESAQDAGEEDDALMTALMNEVNGSLAVPGALSSTAEAAPAATAAPAEINAGRDALKKLMEGNK